jgi:hypothetical protein
VTDTLTNFATGDNWDRSVSGAGIVESAAGIVKGIQSGGFGSIAGNTLAATLDGLAYVENPVKALGTSAFGWIIEHLTALDAFLDKTTGDPDAVTGAAETFYQAARDLDEAAASQIRAFGMEVPTYRSGQSPSAVEFEKRVGPRASELKTLSLQCQGLADSMNNAGVLVGTVRGVMRDLLAEFAYEVFKKGVIALANAPYTNGFSVAFFTAESCHRGSRLAVKLAGKLEELGESLGKQAGMLKELACALGNPAQLIPVSALGNLAQSGGKAVDDDVSLSAADAATQEVAEAERKAEAGPPSTKPNFPSAEKPKQGPGLGVRWTASGTLDE